MFPPTRIAVQNKTNRKSKRKVTDWALWCRCLYLLQWYKMLLFNCDEKAHPNLRGRLKAFLPIYVLIWCDGA